MKEPFWFVLGVVIGVLGALVVQEVALSEWTSKQRLSGETPPPEESES